MFHVQSSTELRYAINHSFIHSANIIQFNPYDSTIPISYQTAIWLLYFCTHIQHTLSTHTCRHPHKISAKNFVHSATSYTEHALWLQDWQPPFLTPHHLRKRSVMQMFSELLTAWKGRSGLKQSKQQHITGAVVSVACILTVSSDNDIGL